MADFKLLPFALLLLASPTSCQVIFPLDRYMGGADDASAASSPEDDAASPMGSAGAAGSDAGAADSVADAALAPGSLDGALQEDSPSDASQGVGAADGAPSEVVYRAASSVRSTTATLTVTIPATVVSGDFLWITLYADGPDTTVTAPAGWIREGSMSDPTNEFGVWWYYRFAVANEVTTAAFTIDTNGAANDPILIDVPPLGVASLVAFGGVDHTSPIQSENAALVTGSPFTSTSMGTPDPGILLVTSFVNDDADAAAVWTPSPPLIGVVEKGNVFTGYAVEGDAGLGGTMTARCNEDGNGLVSVIALNPVGAKGTSKMGTLGTP